MQCVGSACQTPDNTLTVRHLWYAPEAKFIVKVAGVSRKIIRNRRIRYRVTRLRPQSDFRPLSQRLSRRHDILYFATHTELSENDAPLASAILLTDDEEDGRLEVRDGTGQTFQREQVSIRSFFVLSFTPAGRLWSPVCGMWRTVQRRS